MTKYRFRKDADGNIIVRAERKLGNQLISSVTKVIGPNESVSDAMKELYKAVHGPSSGEPFAPGTPS